MYVCIYMYIYIYIYIYTIYIYIYSIINQLFFNKKLKKNKTIEVESQKVHPNRFYLCLGVCKTKFKNS